MSKAKFAERIRSRLSSVVRSNFAAMYAPFAVMAFEGQRARERRTLRDVLRTAWMDGWMDALQGARGGAVFGHRLEKVLRMRAGIRTR